MASTGTFPQIHVVRPPGLMKLRPNAAPNEPGAGKRATVIGRFRMSCVFFVNVALRFRSMSLLCKATALRAASTPAVRSSPPFMILLVRPPEGMVAGWSKSSVIFRM